MHVFVRSVDPTDLQELRWMVSRLVQVLTWRHSGLGVLQGYVHEGDVHELRVHVWHPSLVAPGIDRSGDVHDHRFDLRSTVLEGELEHVEHDFQSAPEGEWRIHDVVHARLAAELVGSHHLVGDEDPARYHAVTSRVTVSAGQRYFFPKRRFHRTAHRDLAVTLVTKIDQELSPPARVAWPVAVPIVHAFERPQPRESWQWLLDDVARRLAT